MSKIKQRTNEAEIISAILNNSSHCRKLIDALKEDDFHDKHRIIFEALINMNENEVAIDSVNLYSELVKFDKLEEIGGATYLAILSNSQPISYSDLERKVMTLLVDNCQERMRQIQEGF